MATVSTPPVTAQTNSTLTNLQFSQTFASSTVGLLGLAQKSSATFSQASSETVSPSDISVAYDAASRSYTVMVATEANKFGPADRDASSSNATITAYEVKVANSTKDFAIFNPGSGNPKLALTYTSYGALQRLVDNGSSISVSQDYFTFGIPTAASDLPRTGKATYQSVIDGSWGSDGDLRALSGSGTLSADFAAGTTSVSLDLGGVSVLNGSSRHLDMFTGGGRIDSSTAKFSGTLSPTTSNYSGTYSGLFFGPTAIEAGATFSIKNGTGGLVVGVIVGHQ